MRTPTICSDCGGSGNLTSGHCPTCLGVGQVYILEDDKNYVDQKSRVRDRDNYLQELENGVYGNGD